MAVSCASHIRNLTDNANWKWTPKDCKWPANSCTQYYVTHMIRNAPGNQLPALAAVTTRVRGTDRALTARLEVALSIIFVRVVM